MPLDTQTHRGINTLVNLIPFEGAENLRTSSLTSLHWRVHLDGPAMPLAKSRKESTLSKRNRGRPTTNVTTG